MRLEALRQAQSFTNEAYGASMRRIGPRFRERKVIGEQVPFLCDRTKPAAANDIILYAVPLRYIRTRRRRAIS